jgi:hypothetical protein
MLYTPVENNVRFELFAESLFTKLSLESDINPAELAQLFMLSMKFNPLQRVLQDTLRTWLLSRTIAHAIENIPFYRERKAVYQDSMEQCGPEVRYSLKDLPIIRRSDLEQSANAFVSSTADLELLSHTSGSTGSPVSIHRSRQEVRFIQQYYHVLLEPVRVQLALKPLCLTFPNFYHGSALPLPSLGMPMVGGVTDNTLIQDAARILSTTHRIPGCSERVQFLSGLSHHIVFFTNYLIERGYEVDQFGLSGVAITGGYISPHWTTFLRRSWNCSIVDRWSMTELVGGATRDYETGLFVFDPHVLAEVVDPHTGRCIEGQGVGELVVTTLYPFAQMQPLIRYATGDLVYQTEIPDRNTPAYAFLGKVKNCIVESQSGTFAILASSAQVYDLLTSWPEASCYDFFPNVTAVKDRMVGSMPVFQLFRNLENSRQCECHVSAQMRFNPKAFPDRCAQLERQLKASMLSAPFTSLAYEIEAGRAELVVELVGPGAIVGEPVIKI